VKLRIVTRLALWYSLVLAGIIGALVSILVIRLHAELIGSVDAELSARAGQIAIERLRDSQSEHDDLTVVPAVAGLSRGEYLIQETDVAHGRVESGNTESERLRFPSPQLRRALNHPVRIAFPVDGESFRFLAVRIGTPATTVLVVGKSLEGVQTTISRFMFMVFFTVPVALGLALLGGRSLSRRALRPIDQITRVAGAISGRDLSARVEVPAVDDEVSRLARTFNAMLHDVESALESQRSFVADAAHELRTPLAIMRSEVDVTLRELNGDDVRRGSLETIGGEVDRLIRMADNLLALARIDEGRLDLLRAPVGLDDIAREVVRTISRLATERGIVVAPSLAHADVIGDRERLRQVIVNVMDNAVRHSPTGGAIRIETGTEDGSAWIAISDEGPGISPADIERAFARFYRAPSSRAGSSAGAGLGLSICKAIVEAHHGSMELRNIVPQGTLCRASFPASRTGGERLDATPERRQ